MRLRGVVPAALALLLAGGPANAAQKLTINYTTGESATAFIAKDEGFFAKHGLDVDLIAVAQNSNAPAALQSGSVQVGMIQIANLLQLTDGGLDFVALAGGAGNEKGVSKFAVVVRGDLNVKEPKDLIGKKVGVPGIGASIDIFFRNWLLNNNVEPARVPIVETTFLAMADNLQARNLDAVTPLEPFITRITSQKIGYEFFNLIDLLPRPKVAALLFASTRGWATQNASTIPELRVAIAEADDFIRANPEKTRAAINKYTKVPLPILEGLPIPAVDVAIRKDDLDFWAGMMQRLHMLQNKLDTGRLIWK